MRRSARRRRAREKRRAFIATLRVDPRKERDAYLRAAARSTAPRWHLRRAREWARIAARWVGQHGRAP
jgi:hypothetical protein